MKRKINFLDSICLFTFTTLLFVIPVSLQGAEGEKILEHETGFYYTVQKGDTLWDLSRKFSDTPWQWPELWQENSQIANPHRIYPGERIRLYRRKGVHPLAQKKPQKHIQEKSRLEELIHYSYSAIDRVGFIRKKPVAAHGTIFKVQEAKEMIHDGDILYIRPEADFILVPGKRYTIYRTLQPIKDRETRKYIGIQHYLTGVVEITQVEPQYAIARVVKSYRPIRIGDLLMPYYRRLPRITLHDSPLGLKGQIIEAEEHQGVIGDNTIAFIDKGKQDGVRPGQFYNVYYQEAHRIYTKSGGKIPLVPVDFGELLVLHTENTTATVLVTRTEQELESGTKIRTPIQ